MGTIYRKITTRPLPKAAVVKARQQKSKKGSQEEVLVAIWTDGKGRSKSAPVTMGADGEYRIQTRASTWTAKFRDGDGFVREVATGCRDRQAANAVLNELTSRAELVKAKVLTTEQAGIADFQDTPLLDHIEAFLEYQRQKSTHRSRVKAYDTRLKESANACGFKFLCNLSSDALVAWLAGQVEGDRRMSASVYNGYIEAWSAFGNWCIGKRTRGKKIHATGQRRLLANPFEGLPKLDEKADRRRPARALTEEELQLLLDAARRRPFKDAMTVRRGENKGQQMAKLSDERKAALERLGHERSLIYKTAILTGLRSNELRTLRIGDLSFGDIPFIHLQRSNEKNRKGSSVPLRSDLAVDLKDWCSGRELDEPVFNVPSGLLRIMNRDLAEAGIVKKGKDGSVIHLHALRHSFGTHLSRAGVAPRTAQAAMRHSNISLTMNTYTDSRLLDTAAAVEALPSLRLGQSLVAPTSVPQGPFESPRVPSGQFGEDQAEDPESAETLEKQGNFVVGGTELESVTSTMSMQLST